MKCLTYAKRLRRRAKAKLKNKKAVRRHTKLGGRTGAIQHKKTRSTKHFKYSIHIPNQPTFYFPLFR